MQSQPDPDQSDDEDGIIKRKGKRRKKRGRDSSRGPLAVQASVDPETQVNQCYKFNKKYDVLQ